jgi:hypothetical protein
MTSGKRGSGGDVKGQNGKGNFLLFELAGCVSEDHNVGTRNISPMTLDEFELGKAWLKQFPFVDREIGRQLLRSLRLVSHTQFATGVGDVISQLLKDVGQENLALFNVVETPTEEDPDKSPKRIAGSSADLVRNMNENLARLYGPRVQAHPTVRSMRAQRIRNVVLVEDFVGTGKRLGTYMRDVMDGTLKSWISYKWTKLWIVSYGGLETGVRAVMRKGYGLTENRIRLATPAQKTGQFFTPLMRDFCKRFAERTERGHIPLGFGNGAVGMIFEHSCPNNAPVILWSKGYRYQPLFPSRGIPVELKSAFSQEDVNRPSNVLWDASQYRLALAMLHESNFERNKGSQWRLLLMLGLASRAGWEDSRIAGILGIPIAVVQTQRFGAYRLGVLDVQTHELTPFGRGLLERIRAASRKEREQRKRTQRSLGETYYPLSCAGLVRH